MRKKSYKGVVNAVILKNKDNFTGLNKREIINLVYDDIIENGLIDDFTPTSLYNTIYYFLRKLNFFNKEEINYRFDSITTKLKFLKTLKSDLVDRWWFYSDLFFGDTKRPVLEPQTKVLSGELNYIIDSGINSSFDFLYTLLYFRDLRKIVSSDMETFFVKRPLNDKLYSVFSDLYKLDELVKIMVEGFSDSNKMEAEQHITKFFLFLSEFNSSEYQLFYGKMIKQVNEFKSFILSSKCPEVYKCNKNRFFDTLSFVTIVYTLILNHLGTQTQLSEFRNIHFMVNSITNFVYFKFSKKLKPQQLNKIVEYFDSNLYFSYTEYIIEYYNVFQKEVLEVFKNSDIEYEETIFQFDIIMRYMLYNKLRNLVNSNLKRFISVDFEINDDSFMDVNLINDSVLYECNLYTNEQIDDTLSEKCFGSVYTDFFESRSDLNKEDVTNVALKICCGEEIDATLPEEILQASYELVDMLRTRING